MEDKAQEVVKKVCEQVVESMESISEEGVHVGNVDYLGKLIDIKKDIANMDYWKAKEDYMRTNYGRSSYGRDEYGARSRDSRGRFMNSGYVTNYRGERIMDDMYNNYQAYSEGRNYGRGNYGGGDKENNLENLSYMLQSVVEFMGMLKQEAGSEEEVDLIRRYAQTLSDM